MCRRAALRGKGGGGAVGAGGWVPVFSIHHRRGVAPLRGARGIDSFTLKNPIFMELVTESGINYVKVQWLSTQPAYPTPKVTAIVKNLCSNQTLTQNLNVKVY